MMRRYFKLQILDDETKINYVDEALADNRITSHIDYAGASFLDINPGDIFLIHKGSHPVCIVEVLYKISNQAEIKGVDFGINYKIRIISYYNDLSNELIFKSKNKAVGHNGTFQQLSNSTKTLTFIKQWFSYTNEKQKMNDYIKLLEYKKQIILQGPPGTGKTRLAELIAKEMTKTVGGKNPISIIDDFFKKFDGKDKSVIEKRTKYLDLLSRFQSKFPKDRIENLSKENYCIGTGSNDSFCWWIERGLISLGYYFPGSARSYLIYWKKSIQGYSKHGLAAQIEDDDEAMSKIANLISDLLKDENSSIAKTFLGNSFILKILHSYYPEKYFPVNSIPCLDNILKLFGENYTSLSAIDKNLKVQELFNQKRNTFGSDVSNIEFMKFLFKNFDLKGNIEITTNQIITKGKYKIIQFHPSFTYEDFVRGISAKTSSDNKVFYKVEDRILMEFAQEAMNNPRSNFVLILDEINRANLSSVLGELIYALEYRYDHKKNNLEDTSVESLYDISEDDEEPKRTLLLPENLHIIGTMNTADRSVGHIDYAIRRRFAFANVLPKDLSNESEITFDEKLFRKVSKLFISNYDNYLIDTTISLKHAATLSPEFNPEDVWLGHSYFIDKSNEGGSINVRLQYEIKPILLEYVKDGILVGKVNDISVEDYIKNL